MSGHNPAAILYNPQGTNAISTVSGLDIERLAVDAELAQGTMLDAFGRLRFSGPQTLFDSKYVYDDQSLFFSDQVTAGGTIVRDANKSVMVLSTAGGSTDRVIRQTKRYFPYQPGKSHLYLASFNFLNTDTNITKRVGIYDNNNGLFLEQANTTLSFVLRSDTSGSVVNTVIARSSWNEDKFDGTGKSGLTLDFTKAQILFIDYEWLGTGQIRFGFCVNGRFLLAHKISNFNTLSSPYMRTPDLPVRFEIQATGASLTSSMYAICSTVISEGGRQITGSLKTANRGNSVFTTSNATTLYPLLALRISSANIRKSIKPAGLSIINTTSTAFFWSLRINPTITGGATANWQTITNSGVEFDITRTGSVSGGIEILSGYGSSKFDQAISSLDSVLDIGASVDGTSDQLILCVRSISAANEDYLASISWLEN